MVQRSSGLVADAESPASGLIQPDSTGLDEESHEQEPRGSLILLLLFLAAMVGVWLYVYFLLLERV